MSTQQQVELTLEDSLKLLKEYSCMQIKVVESDTDKEQLRQALLLITGLSEYETIGICADNVAQGFQSLANYLQALGYDFSFDSNQFLEKSGAVYIKYNTQKMTHYIDSYTGSYRGVLISCQGENDALMGTYGHFPLDLFN